MPFDFFDAGDGVFESFADFGDVGSIVDDFGGEFLSSADFSFTDFDIPVGDVADLGGWTEVGNFAGNADWFDTFNSGAITDFASSVSSGATGFFDSISSSLPSLSSIKDFAGSVGDSIAAGYNAVKDALPSLDKIKEVAAATQKAIDPYIKTATTVVKTYQKIAPAVNAASAALGIQNPINQIIQPLTQAVAVAGGVSSAAGGVASGISETQKAASSTGGFFSNLFGPSESEKAENYNQAKSTIESTDSALKTYDAERAASTQEILRASDNISEIQSRIDNPDTTDEERAVLESNLKDQYDNLAVAQRSLEQTNTTIEAVTTARNNAANIVASADASTVKNAAFVQTKQQVENYNQAVSTVSSTDKALKQYDADKAAATQDILRTSDNISTIQSKIDDPNTSDEERAVAEAQLKSQYDQLAIAQRSLEQTNEAAAAVTAARDEAAQVVASTNLNTIKTPYQVDQYGLVILDAKATAQLEKNISPGYANSLVPGVGQNNENYNQAKATVESTNAALKQFDAEKAAYTSDIVKTSDNIYNINQRLNDPNTSAEDRALLEEQLQGEYARLAETQKALEQTNFAAEQVTAARDQAAQVIANTDTSVLGQAAAVAGVQVDQYKAAYDSVTKTFSIFDTTTGQTVQSGLTEQQAMLAEQDLNLATGGITLKSVAGSVSNAVTGVLAAGAAAAGLTNLFTGPDGNNATTVANSITAAQTNQARAQQSVRELRNNKAQSSDWRVRLKLAPNSNYLYNAPANQVGILAPLAVTDGVIFPYTPSIETAYKANYDAYDLTHSNYRGYFYKGSYVDAVNVRGTFTAQDTKEADYLLAVIHFFRSCTKMFYGKDVQRGSPPPLVYLNGYGDYQFAEHPCVVSQFNYTLPPDVDYIRAQSTLQSNTNQLNNRLRNPIANNPLAYSVNRMLNSSLIQGALNYRPTTPGTGNLATGTPSYVPTKMEISITLLPVQSRSQISNNFSVKEFANGNLLKGGYW